MYLVTVTEREPTFTNLKHFKRDFKAIEKFFKAACVSYGVFSAEPICEKTILAKESTTTHEIIFEKLTSREVEQLKRNEPNLFNN